MTAGRVVERSTKLPVRASGPRLLCNRCATVRKTFVERVVAGYVSECAACGLGLGPIDAEAVATACRRQREVVAAMHARMLRGARRQAMYWRGTVWIATYNQREGYCTRCSTQARLWALRREWICGACYRRVEAKIAGAIEDGCVMCGK